MRLVVIDDHPILRDAIRAMLGTCDPSKEVIGEASTAREGAEVIGALEPDVVIMDILMPGLSGLASLRDLRRDHPGIRLVVYTALTEPSVAIEALAAGAGGYALKADCTNELLVAIEQVGRGNVYVAPSIKEAVTSVRASGVVGGLASLSPRELQLFELIVKGYTNDRMAKECFISVKTVETHRSRINRKLGVHSTPELIRFAALNGRLFS
jgi:DNA-binding NarL/FixJ family response regulator